MTRDGVVGVGAAEQRTYERLGYADVMRTQIDHGILGYCGVPVVGSDFLLHSDAPSREKALGRAFNVGSAFVRLGNRAPVLTLWAAVAAMRLAI